METEKLIFEKAAKFGTYLRISRLKKGLTCWDIEERTGGIVKASYIRFMESTNKFPSPKKLMAVIRALEVGDEDSKGIYDYAFEQAVKEKTKKLRKHFGIDAN